MTRNVCGLVSMSFFDSAHTCSLSCWAQLWALKLYRHAILITECGTHYSTILSSETLLLHLLMCVFTDGLGIWLCPYCWLLKVQIDLLQIQQSLNVATLGNVIDPTQIIKKPSLLPKLLPSEILRIMDPPSRWKNLFC